MRMVPTSDGFNPIPLRLESVAARTGNISLKPTATTPEVAYRSEHNQHSLMQRTFAMSDDFRRDTILENLLDRFPSVFVWLKELVVTFIVL